MPTEQLILLILCGLLFAAMGLISYFSGNGTLNIKSKTVGDGQHGAARWATRKEISKTFHHVHFTPQLWREENSSSPPQRKSSAASRCQGIVVGCTGTKKRIIAQVDTGDVHALMIGAAGVGKTAYFMIPNIEYALASGMSIMVSDTKGDLQRQYAPIARERYGYEVSVLDLRNPACSDGFNMLHLINRYTDEYAHTGKLSAKAKAERYAKITAKTIIGEDGARGQNAFFYEAAEGLLTAVLLLIAEFCPNEQRHIVSAFKLIQDLLAPSNDKQNRTLFQLLMEKLPSEHKARWLAGAALNSSTQGMMSVLSTAMSKLNAFIDSDLEQLLCFDTTIDAESFISRKSALFVVLPEENPSTFFLVSLIIQQLYRELLSVADEHGGKLPRRALFLLDEFGSLPKIDSAEVMFSAGRSRRISIVAIIQSMAQLEQNYGREGASIIEDNCQLTIYGGFAPGSDLAQTLSKNLGDITVQSGYISKGKGDGSRTLQMTGRPLISPDELKALPKGRFIVTKTGCYPMQSRLRLFTEWGITFADEWRMPEQEPRPVAYVNRLALERAILEKYPLPAAVRTKASPPELEDEEYGDDTTAKCERQGFKNARPQPLRGGDPPAD
ncbi:type IV secretory system conjugative DNA transfer family protein [Oscillospiraceae bacterium OttesenSCG-928-G22]|nr:type IV secretory system conjugative DNA transfer family protein [Oscillospiraceae bacterium OttesenSCG-928-G22]